jgi:hypothetical protein
VYKNTVMCKFYASICVFNTSVRRHGKALRVPRHSGGWSCIESKYKLDDGDLDWRFYNDTLCEK